MSKHKWQPRAIDLRRHGRHGERNGLPGSEVAGQRPPRDRDVDLASCHRVDDARRGIRLRVIAVHGVPDDVRGDVALSERMRWRGVRVVVANHLHADAQLPQRGIVE